MKAVFFLASHLAVLVPLVAIAQNTAANNKPPKKEASSQRFCAKDPRVEVRTFCEDLARFQTHVNNAKAAGKTPTVDGLKADLNALDANSPDSTDKYVSILAPKVTASQVYKSAASESKSLAEGLASASNQQRLDQQLSSDSAASGTTSLVSKAGSAQLLSLALDTGALTRSVNGTTTTLTTNADQLFRLATNDNPDCTVTCVNSGWFQTYVLNPVTLSVTMDLAQRSSTNTPTSGQASGTTTTTVNTAAIPTGAGKFSSLTARYQVWNKFDPRSKQFKDKWNSASDKHKLGTYSDQVKAATDAITKDLTGNAATLARGDMLAAAVKDPSGDGLADYFYNYVTSVSEQVLQDDRVRTGVGDIMQKRAAYREAWFDALHEATGNMFTFEYNYNRPFSQPITHDFKLIYGHDFDSHGMVTANGSVSIYDTIPTAAKYGRLHYGQVSFQYDRNLFGSDKAMQTQLSLAGYWQYQPHPSILNIPAGTVVPGTTIPLPNGTQEFVGTAGSLWVTQAKLTIKGSGGINIPVGVSWSNKTDLLQGSKVGAQVGISYNFSSLAGLFTGSGNQ